MNTATRHRIVKARIRVSNADSFLSELVYRLILKEDSSVPTTATDGVFMFYNPAFIDSLSDAEVCGCVEHETFHNVFDHVAGFMAHATDGADTRTRNQACDYAINQLQHFPLPKDALCDHAGRFRGMSHRRIYDILKHQPKPPQSQNPQNGQDGKPCDSMRTPADGNGKELDNAARQAIREGWEIATIQAANVAQTKGQLPAGLEHLVNELKRGEIDWPALLDRFMRDRVKSDYSLIPPNRRYLSRGLYLHSIAEKERMRTVVDAIDTSGSIYAYRDLLNRFMNEQAAILREIKPESLTLIECDAAIQRVREFTPEEFPESTDIIGGGGTDFRPVFEHIDREGIEPECLIYFTDLEGSFPDVAPPYPVLWIVYGGREEAPPFGEVIHIR